MLHRPRRTLHAIAAAVTVCALAAPTATAVPAEQFLKRAEGKPANDATTVPVRVVNVRADGGFDWGDAGIGAGSGLALVLIGVGSALALRQRPGRTAPAS
jgi:hypothetical protein